MSKTNSVFTATSMDGYIADRDGGIGWLESVPGLNDIDTGYAGFTAEIDALVMGRITFETVCSFDIEWPYAKPVYVLSNTMKCAPANLDGKVFPVKGSLLEILEQIHNKGHSRLYIDGGKVIQSFLKEDLIDEMIITVIPVLLGGGAPLFADLPTTLRFECMSTKLFLDQVVQNHFVRRR